MELCHVRSTPVCTVRECNGKPVIIHSRHSAMTGQMPRPVEPRNGGQFWMNPTLSSSAFFSPSSKKQHLSLWSSKNIFNKRAKQHHSLPRYALETGSHSATAMGGPRPWSKSVKSWVNGPLHRLFTAQRTNKSRTGFSLLL